MKDPNNLTGLIDDYTPSTVPPSISTDAGKKRTITTEQIGDVKVLTMHDDAGMIVIYRFMKGADWFDITESDLEAIAQFDDMSKDIRRIANHFEEMKVEVASWKRV